MEYAQELFAKVTGDVTWPVRHLVVRIFTATLQFASRAPAGFTS